MGLDVGSNRSVETGELPSQGVFDNYSAPDHLDPFVAASISDTKSPATQLSSKNLLSQSLTSNAQEDTNRELETQETDEDVTAVVSEAIGEVGVDVAVSSAATIITNLLSGSPEIALAVGLSVYALSLLMKYMNKNKTSMSSESLMPSSDY